MAYVKAILSGIAAIIVTELLTIWWVLRPSQAQATGIDLIIAIVRGSVLWPLSWILAKPAFQINFCQQERIIVRKIGIGSGFWSSFERQRSANGTIFFILATKQAYTETFCCASSQR